MTADPVFLSRAELGMLGPKSISRNVHPDRGGVMPHWGGGPQRVTTLDTAVRRWLRWQQIHMAPGGLGALNGGADIAYNLGFWDRYILAGRGQSVRSGANGTNDANTIYLAVAWIGGQGERPSEQDVATFQHIVRMLREGGAGLAVKPHSFVRPTACPGDDWRGEAAKIDGKPTSSWGSSEPPPKPEPPEPPKPKPEPPTPPTAATWTETLVENLPLRRRRTDLGRADAFDRRIQGLLAAAGVLDIAANIQGGRLDGKFGPSTERAVRTFQQRARIGVDGIVGRQTWTKLLGR